MTSAGERLQALIAAIDGAVARQLDAILRHPELQALEGGRVPARASARAGRRAGPIRDRAPAGDRRRARALHARDRRDRAAGGLRLRPIAVHRTPPDGAIHRLELIDTPVTDATPDLLRRCILHAFRAYEFARHA